jgi:hypothetical protein
MSTDRFERLYGRVLLTMAVGVILLACGAASAVGKVVLGPIGVAVGPVLSDGSGIAATQITSREVAVYSDRSGTTGTIAVPATCIGTSTTADLFSQVTGGLLIWDACGDSPTFLDSATGREFLIADAPLLESSFGPFAGSTDLEVVDAGRDWVQVDASSEPRPVFWNVATAKVVPQSSNVHVDEDLNSPQLVVPLCKGIQRPLIPETDPDGGPAPSLYPMLQREGSYALSIGDGGVTNGQEGTFVTLERCGHPAIALYRASALGGSPAVTPQIGAGTVTWGVHTASAAEIDVYNIASRRRQVLRIPNDELNFVVSHTAHHLYLSQAKATTTAAGNTVSWTILQGTL